MSWIGCLEPPKRSFPSGLPKYPVFVAADVLIQQILAVGGPDPAARNRSIVHSAHPLTI